MIEIKYDSLNDHWVAYMDLKEISKAKTLSKCLKSFTAYIKGQGL